MRAMSASPSYLSPSDKPFAAEWLPVDGGHRLYIEQRGHPEGIPAIVLHGGPGSGNSPAHAGFFAADRYRVILPDQRGAGRSESQGGMEANTTADLLADIERIRIHLGIDRWLVVGGSWGATLGLLYAAAHPEHITGLLLRNPFLARAADLDWFFGGAREHHPEAWLRWAELGAPESPGAMLPWLDESLRTADGERQSRLVAAWHAWECTLAGTASRPLSDGETTALAKRYHLQCHYFRNACFLVENAVLRAAELLGKQDMPIHVVQGLDDHVCPASETRLLLQQMVNASCEWIEGVGHDPFALSMQQATLVALDAFAATGNFKRDLGIGNGR